MCNVVPSCRPPTLALPLPLLLLRTGTRYITQSVVAGDGSTPANAWNSWETACNFMESTSNPTDTLVILGAVNTDTPNRRCLTKWNIVGLADGSSMVRFRDGASLGMRGNGNPLAPQNITALAMTNTGTASPQDQYLIEAYSDQFLMEQLYVATGSGSFLWTNASQLNISTFTIVNAYVSLPAEPVLPAWITVTNNSRFTCNVCYAPDEIAFTLQRPIFGAFGQGAEISLVNSIFIVPLAGSPMLHATYGAKVTVYGTSVLGCTGTHGLYLGGVGACFHFSKAQYSIEQSAFRHCVTETRACIYAEDSTGEFYNNIFYNMTGDTGSSILVDGGSTVVNFNEFSLSTYPFIGQGSATGQFSAPSAVVVQNALYNVTLNVFSNLAAPFCPALIISPNSYGSITNNLFERMEPQSLSVVCVTHLRLPNGEFTPFVGSTAGLPPASHFIGAQNIFHLSLSTPYEPAIFNASSCVMVEDTTVLLGENEWGADFLPIPVFGAVNSSVNFGPGVDKTGFYGFTLASSTLSLSGDVEVKGNSAFIGQARNPQTNVVYGFGNTLTLSGSRTWLQNVNFDRVNVVSEQDLAIVCCNAGRMSAASGLTFLSGSTFNLSGNADWYSAIYAANFSDTSKLIISDTGVLRSTFPLKSDAEINQRLPVVYSQEPISNYGTFQVVDFKIVGSYQHASSEARTILYPSMWSGRNHTLRLSGDFSSAIGAVVLDESLRTGVFYPPFALSDPPMAVIESNGTISVGSVRGMHAKYSVLSTFGALVVKATELSPQITMDDSGGALLFDFIGDTSILSVSSDCSGLLAPGSPQIGYPRSCGWINDTRLILTSPQLPMPGTMFDLATIPGVLAPGGNPIFPALNPIIPVALFRQEPRYYPIDGVYCTTVVLDASLSTGLGSLDAHFKFYVEGEPTLQAYFDGRPPTVPTLRLPPSYIISGKTYNFSVTVTNWAGRTSLPSAPLIITIDTTGTMPPVALQGSSQRVHYVGSDLVVVASLEHTECYDPGLVHFSWTQISGPLLPSGSVPSSSSPSLYIAGIYLTSPAEYSFQLTASLDDRTMIPLDIIANISLIDAPFSIIRTSQYYFKPTDTVQLSVRLGTTLGFTAGIAPQFSWKGYSCDNADATNTRPSINPQLLLASYELLPPLECLSPTNVTFPVNLQNADQTTVSLDASTLFTGSYTLIVKATLGSVSKVALVPFQIGQSSTPSVSIRMGSLLVVRPEQKLSFVAVVDGRTGSDASSIADMAWEIKSGVSGSTSPAPLPSTGSTLTIPFSDIQFGVPLKLKLTASYKNAAALAASFETSFDLAIPPWGGRFNVSASSGTSGATPFTFIAAQWSSVVAPLRYQFAMVDENSEILEFLTAVTEIPVLSNLVLYNPSSSDPTVRIRLTVFDGVGATTSETLQISLATPTDVLSGSSLLNISEVSLPQALNHSNYFQGARLINTLVSELKLREHLMEPLDNATLDTIHVALARSALRLSAVLSLTEANSPVLVSMLSTILNANVPLDGKQKTDLFGTLQAVLASPSAAFGDFNRYSWASTTFLIDTIAGALKDGSQDYRPEIPLQVVYNHGDHLLASTASGQPLISYSTPGLFVAARKPEASSREEVIEHQGTTVKFNPSGPGMDAVDGFIAYHYAQYDGTFPGLPPDAPFRTVAYMSYQNSKRRREIGQAMDSGGRYTTTFNVTTTVLQSQTNPPTCSVYNSGGQSWSSSGCTTTSNADGTVSCDCGNSGPLTVLFTSPFAANPSSKSKGLPAVAIAFIVIGSVLALLIILVILGVLFVPSFRHFVRPFSKRSEKTADPTSSVSMTTTGQWAKANKPGAL